MEEILSKPLRSLINSLMQMTQEKLVQPKRSADPPFDLNANHPTKFQQYLTDANNKIFNRLYPVKPTTFLTMVLCSIAYYSRVASSLLLSGLARVYFLGSFEGLRILVASVLTAYAPVLACRLFLWLFFFRYKRFVFEDPKTPSTLTKFWAVCYTFLKKVVPPRLETCDALLPRLPVPPLQETVDRYMDTVKPYMSADEYDRVVDLGTTFLEEEGPRLQRYAQVYSWLNANYVTPFWEKYAYHYSREPLPINSSVAHIDVLNPTPANQAVKAAHIMYISACNMLAINNQSHRPPGDGLAYGGHYSKMFSTVRIPGERIDELKQYRYSKHVVMYSRGCFYKVDVFDENNRLYSVEELTEIITELLLRNEVVADEETKVAALTHDRRDTWHRNRNRFFLDDEVNRETLHIIESSIGFMTLDEHDDYVYDPDQPELLDRWMANMLAGDGKSRWVDKSLNIAISKNGRFGGTEEHSIGDGAEFDHLVENIFYTDHKFLTYPKDVQDIDSLTNFRPRTGLKLAERLKFNLNDEMKAEISRCYDEYLTFKDDLDLASVVFRDFGKGTLKKAGIAPDGFLQMALQLTNFKDQGKFVLTYEAASARFYAKSRTETLRTVSHDSCAFVRAMLDPTSNATERIRLLRTACEAHQHRAKMAITGQGVDRHLFVLTILSRGLNVKSPFLDNYISQPWLLSTSQLPNMTGLVDEDKYPDQSWLGAAFGAVTKQGYGVCYRFAGNHSICCHITSYKSSENTDSQRFRSLLVQSLHEMSALLKLDP